MPEPDLNRRNILKLGLLALGATCVPKLSFASTDSPRALQMNNLHTGEILTTEYFDGRHYQRCELQKINHFCRDFRQNKAINMDKHLFDQLSKIQHIIGCCNEQIQIISGYRSPETNRMLRKNSTGVAKKSLHMQGRAIDFRIESVPLAEIRKAALSLKAGGVGYYPGSNFVHIDTGHVRTWSQ
ncbi:MAG: DUF882 domain-containing protein [Psychromonas sp.]|nr:DUF882 domain-containing protein [Psychromonas sp.]